MNPFNRIIEKIVTDTLLECSKNEKKHSNYEEKTMF